MRKRNILTVLALWLALAALPVRAAAADTDVPWDNLSWSYNESSGTLSISGTGNMPETFTEAYPFHNYKDTAKSLEIGPGVTSVGAAAFRGYTSLERITFSGDHITIGDNAFSGCQRLNTLTFPSNVVKLGNDAFRACSGLTSVGFPGDVGEIGGHAFDECYQLASLSFGGTVGPIGPQAFQGCPLTGLRFPQAVGDIGDGAFQNCDKLTSLSFDGTVGNIGPQAFQGCPFTGLSFPQAVGSIGDGAFASCAALKELTFSGTGGNIGNRAFSGCKSLTRVRLPDGVGNIGDRVFEGCESLTLVAIPDHSSTLQTVGKSLFNGCPLMMDLYFGGSEGRWGTIGGSSVLGSGSQVTVHYDQPNIQMAYSVGDSGTLQDLFSDKGQPKDNRVDIVLENNIENLTVPLKIPENWNVVIDLNGHTLKFDADRAIDMQGNILLVLDSTQAKPPVAGENYQTVDYTAGGISCTGDAVYIQPGRTLILQGGHIQAGGTGITVFADRNKLEGGVGSRLGLDTEARINGGYVEAEGSAVTILGEGAKAYIRGGVFLSTGAPVISGGESESEGGTEISVSNAVLIGRNSAPNQLACAIYHPQRGDITTIQNSDLYVEDGIGILMRGGSVHVDGGSAIHASGSNSKTGTISKGEALPSGHLIAIDQLEEGSIRVTLGNDLLQNEAYKPYSRLLEGFDLVTPDSAGGSAYYVIRIRTVTFDFNFPNAPAPQKQPTKGGVVPSLPGVPRRPGYEFYGWSSYSNVLARTDLENVIISRDTTYYAQWIPEGALVIRFIGGPEAETLKATGPDKILTDWPKGSANGSGQAFLGWYTLPEDGGEEYPFDRPFTEETSTLYAHHGQLQRPHTITFDPAGGSFGGDPTAKEEETDNQGVLEQGKWPAEPELEGYCFQGWSWSASYDIMLTKEYGPYRNYEFYEDFTLYARWIPEEGYPVTFYPNNGEPPCTLQTDGNGLLAQWPDDPRLADYTFGGWYRWSGSGYVYASDKFTSRTNLYAYWIKNGGVIEPGDPKMFRIAFDPSGGALSPGTGPEAVTSSDGTLAVLPLPTWEGHTFLGWFTAKEGGDPVTEGTVFSADATIYAHWSDNSAPGQTTYTVTFDSRGGSAVSAQAVASGGKAAKPADPTRNGYRFGGWFKDAACSSAWSFASDSVTGNVTLYAKWTADTSSPPAPYAITFDPNGGTLTGGATAITAENGKLAKMPTAPTRDKFGFDAWYTAKEGGKTVDTTYQFTQDTTVYAHWKENAGGDSGDSGNGGGDSGDTGNGGGDSGDTGNGGGGTGPGGGGGSAGEETAYSIRVASKSQHGTVSPSHSSAKAGTQVTLTVNLETDYIVDWIEVKTEDRQRARLSRTGGRWYTFTMPSSDVTVEFSLQAAYSAFIPPQAQAAAQAPAAPTATFTPITWRPAAAMRDVPANSWAYPAAQWAYQNGYLDTASDGTFRLGDTVSHIQLWRIMARWLGEPAWDNDSAIQWARKSGAAKIGSASGAMTRQNMVEYLYQCYFLMGGDVSVTGNLLQYRDSQQITSVPAKNAWIWAVNKGIISGTPDGSLNPNGILNRGEFAAILMRMCQKG